MTIRTLLLRAACVASLSSLFACASGPAPEQTAQQRAEAERTAAYRKNAEAKEQATLEALAATDPERAKRSEQRMAASKEMCGDDYRAPRIGMPMARALQCVARLRLATQSSRSGGILSTYQAEGLYIEEYGGKVVGWGVR